VGNHGGIGNEFPIAKAADELHACSTETSALPNCPRAAKLIRMTDRRSLVLAGRRRFDLEAVDNYPMSLLRRRRECVWRCRAWSRPTVN